MSPFVKTLVDRVIIRPCRQVGALRRFANYVSRGVSDEGYHELRERFVSNGSSGLVSSAQRREILGRLEAIDAAIELGSTPAEGLALVEALLSLPVSGDVIECGCFNGGSTAKLSIIAKLTGRRLLVFDSFEGLPAVDDYNRKDFNARKGSEWVTEWTAGRYAARLDQVKANVSRYGESSVCTFHKGWFADTLRPEVLPERVAFAFVDVDIASSARECLSAIWPRLVDGGIFFLHDVGFIKLLQSVLDETLWTRELKQFPPILFGAGYGLGDESPYLGFMVKGRDISAEYVNSLTVCK